MRPFEGSTAAPPSKRASMRAPCRRLRRSPWTGPARRHLLERGAHQRPAARLEALVALEIAHHARGHLRIDRIQRHRLLDHQVVAGAVGRVEVDLVRAEAAEQRIDLVGVLQREGGVRGQLSHARPRCRAGATALRRPATCRPPAARPSTWHRTRRAPGRRSGQSQLAIAASAARASVMLSAPSSCARHRRRAGLVAQVHQERQAQVAQRAPAAGDGIGPIRAGCRQRPRSVRAQAGLQPLGQEACALPDARCAPPRGRSRPSARRSRLRAAAPAPRRRRRGPASASSSTRPKASARWSGNCTGRPARWSATPCEQQVHGQSLAGLPAVERDRCRSSAGAAAPPRCTSIVDDAPARRSRGRARAPAGGHVAGSGTPRSRLRSDSTAARARGRRSRLPGASGRSRALRVDQARRRAACASAAWSAAPAWADSSA